MWKIALLSISIFTAISCSLFSCSNSPLNESAGLIFKERISLNIDENIYYFSKVIFAFKDEHTGREYLSLENNDKGQHEIVIFDLDDGNVVNRIDIKQDGPDAIFMFGHLPINLNTLFVTSTAGQMIYKIDDTGRILDSYDYSKSSDNQFVSLASSMSIIYRPLILKDSCFYFPQGVLKFTMDKDDWAKMPMGAKVDIKKGFAEKTELTYPVMSPNQINVVSQINVCPNLIFDGENFIYHFAKKDDIIVTKDNKSSKTYSVKSRYADHIKPSLNAVSDMLESERRNISESMYWHLIYDKYRDVYYRFVFLPCEFEKKDDVMQLTHTRQEFTIMIINRDFEVIGETKFPKNRYMPKMVFVGEKGLYISENNPYSDEFSEDKLVFSCFVPNIK